MEANQSLRRNLHLLSPCNPIHPSADATAARRSDRSPFTAAQKPAENSANCSAAARFDRCILPPAGALFGDASVTTSTG